MNTLLYLSGEPGTGKSTLMAELTRPWGRWPVLGSPAAPARDWLLSDGVRLSSRVAVEVGRRRDSFSGTDALPQTVIDAAETYLRSGMAADETDLLLAEGARLGNRRFLTAATGCGWRVILAHLYGPQVAADRRAARAAALGKRQQNPSWVKGRRTAADNLAGQAPGWGCTVLGIDAAASPPVNASILRAMLGATHPLVAAVDAP